MDLASEFAEQGFVRLDGFADRDTCDGMLARVVEISRHDRSAGLIMPEVKLAGGDGAAETCVSKIFSLHRDTVFAEFAHSSDVTNLVQPLIGPSLVCFLSQFIFKNPGAWGQPWHQDSFYFPFEPARPIVGVWLAVTDATLENGCLHVLPGSHREPVHHHVPDARPDSQYGYYEIVDHEMSAAVPVLMRAGDLLLFDSHLMHRSTDNVSSGIRAAMVYHYAMAGTRELSPSPVTDFVLV